MPKPLPVTALLALLWLQPVAAADPDAAERWPLDDAEERAQQVNEGELVFHAAVDPAVHTLHSELTLTASSLEDGWVALRQCHTHLDAVPALQVSYRYRELRDLTLVSQQHIGRIWVEGQSVQLQDIGRQAGFCVTAQVRLVHPEAGGWWMENGPFYRGFLDGYYPFHVRLDLHYPAGLLRLRQLEPAPQTGLTLSQREDGLSVEASFSGRLTLRFHFTR